MISTLTLFRALITQYACRLVKIFPDIFQGIYGLSPGLSGVAFSVSEFSPFQRRGKQNTDHRSVGLGTGVGCVAALYYDTIAPRLSAKHPAKKPEYLRLPLACAAAPFFVVSLLWLGWTSRKDINLMVPLAALLPYGFAYQLIFVAMINVSGARPVLVPCLHIMLPLSDYRPDHTEETDTAAARIGSTSPTRTKSTRPRRWQLAGRRGASRGR